MARPRPRLNRARRWLAAGALAAGAWLAADAAWIETKAVLAQHLVRRAWTERLHGEAQPRPWAWADTWPVARLRAPEQGQDLIVLAGANGSSLAFAPGHLSASAMPGGAGTVAIAGHRDTHFAFLRHLRRDDPLLLQGADGHTRRYRVTDARVADSRREPLRLDDARDELLLITCYPFEALGAGGPLRLVVRAALDARPLLATVATAREPY